MSWRRDPQDPEPLLGYIVVGFFLTLVFGLIEVVLHQ